MIKTITLDDINWKNISLLVKFINEGGRIMNRLQSRLPTYIHRKLARMVKHCRNMGLLPHTDFVKATDKVPITSNYQMFYEDTVQTVDPGTGMIKAVTSPSDQDRFTYANFDNETMAKEDMLRRIEDQKFKNQLNLNTAGLPFQADQKQRKLLMAQNYLLKQQIKTQEESKSENNEENNLTLNTTPNHQIKEINKIEEESYKNIKDLIKNKVNVNNILDAYLYEKTYMVNDVRIYIKIFLLA